VNALHAKQRRPAAIIFTSASIKKEWMLVYGAAAWLALTVGVLLYRGASGLGVYHVEGPPLLSAADITAANKAMLVFFHQLGSVQSGLCASTTSCPQRLRRLLQRACLLQKTPVAMAVALLLWL
jgi:hypothetical protein